MFTVKLRDRETALIFDAGNPRGIADRIRTLAHAPPLYARLSRNGESAAQTFFCPLKYHELISRWLANTDEDRTFLSQFSLSSGRYDLDQP